MVPSAFVAGKELTRALGLFATPVDCSRDRVLFRQGDDPTGVYLVRAGGATLSMHSVSGEIILRIEAGPGSVLGLPGLIGNKPYSLTAVAHGGSQVGFVTRDEFTALMTSEPLLSLKVLEVLAAEVHTARQAIFES